MADVRGRAAPLAVRPTVKGQKQCLAQPPAPATPSPGPLPGPPPAVAVAVVGPPTSWGMAGVRPWPVPPEGLPCSLTADFLSDGPRPQSRPRSRILQKFPGQGAPGQEAGRVGLLATAWPGAAQLEGMENHKTSSFSPLTNIC